MNLHIILVSLALFALPASTFAIVPNDPFYEDLWYLEKIDAPEAWDQATGSHEVVVAVLDAGVDTDHIDLQGNLWTNTAEVAGNNVDDDGNGFIDDVHGWDFVDHDNSVEPDVSLEANIEAVSHGTLISGMIGALGNNEEGVTGINWNVSIMPVRMLDLFGSGTSVDASSAVDYAVANGADVINLSFAGTSNDPNLERAIERAYDAGVVVVAAMGNENSGENNVFPACYGIDDEDWVIGVASVNSFDRKSSFSNFGDCVDISAPGEGIFGLSYQDDSGDFDALYDGNWAGTSMAAPVVSGAAAILLSEYPDLTPQDISIILKLSVDPLTLAPVLKGKMGSGRINLNNALTVGASFAASSDDEEKNSVETVDTSSVVTTSTNATVYFLSGEENRRAFINENAYFTYFDSFTGVDEIAATDLSGYTLTGLMLPKAGVVLVKIQSDPRVYALEENPEDMFEPILREITSEEITIEMYGSNWADYVIDIEPTFFTHFTVGDAITSPIDVDVSIMKTREELSLLAM